MAEQPNTVSTVGDDALGTSDATDLLERLSRREVSGAELRAAALARLRDSRSAINAVVCEIDTVLDAEPAADGPFAGLPLPIKDTDDVAGLPSTWGSYAFGPKPARHTSVFVRQLMELGFAPLAKTTMPEFGLTATTQSRRFGDTRNPWDTARSVGGSSGGSAALVAAGVTPMAHCNDGGGSTRIPAANCGLVGLKPSRGRLIDRPELEQAPVNLFTQGVLSRTVRDTALYYARVERLYANPALPPIGHVTAATTRRLRMAVVSDGLAGIPIDSTVRSAVEGAAALCESLGHQVEPVGNPYPVQVARDFLRYWSLLAFTFKHLGRRLYGPNFDGSKTDSFTDGLAEMLPRQAERMPGSLRRLRALARTGAPWGDGYDVVIGPVLGHSTPLLEWLAPEVPFRTHLVRLLRYVTATPLENVTGAPAISLPLARTATNLPIGVQFSAGTGQEALLLELALQLEEASPWPMTPPPTSRDEHERAPHVTV